MSWPGGEYLSITVYVYDASNMTPIPYATVTVSDAEGYVSGIQGTTGPNGYVTFNNVPLVMGDTYYITASANGYKSNTVSYVSFQLEELSHVSIGLTPTQWTPGPSPTPPSGGNYLTVTVYVYDVSNNSPIVGATVTITDSQGYVSGLQGTTGPDGYVVFSNVPYYPNDTYYITASQINYNSNTVSYTGQQLASLRQVNIGLTSIFTAQQQQQTTQPTQPSAPSWLGKGTTIVLIGAAVAAAGIAAYAVASRRKK
jgi:hypothetical protein